METNGQASVAPKRERKPLSGKTIAKRLHAAVAIIRTLTEELLPGVKGTFFFENSDPSEYWGRHGSFGDFKTSLASLYANCSFPNHLEMDQGGERAEVSLQIDLGWLGSRYGIGVRYLARKNLWRVELHRHGLRDSTGKVLQKWQRGEKFIHKFGVDDREYELLDVQDGRYLGRHDLFWRELPAERAAEAIRSLFVFWNDLAKHVSFLSGEKL